MSFNFQNMFSCHTPNCGHFCDTNKSECVVSIWLQEIIKPWFGASDIFQHCACKPWGLILRTKHNCGFSVQQHRQFKINLMVWTWANADVDPTYFLQLFYLRHPSHTAYSDKLTWNTPLHVYFNTSWGVTQCLSCMTTVWTVVVYTWYGKNTMRFTSIHFRIDLIINAHS